MTDPIADMLTRIRNASSARKDTVDIPFSKIKFEITKILKKENYITDFVKKGKGTIKFLEITLKYKEDDTPTPQSRVPLINEIRRVSRLGQRIYVPARRIKLIKNGYGISVISTPKGLMTDKEARKAKVGGEVLLEVW